VKAAGEVDTGRLNGERRTAYLTAQLSQVAVRRRPRVRELTTKSNHSPPQSQQTSVVVGVVLMKRL